MDPDSETLTSRQNRAIERVHLVAVAALILIVIAMNVLDRGDIPIWWLVGIGFLCLMLVVVVTTVVVARIEHRPVSEVVNRTATQYHEDVTKKINSVRRR